MRLLEQALSDLGFHEAAAQLQQESGIALEPPTVERLRTAVKQGAFDKAVSLVAQLQLGSGAQTQHAQFLLLEQKYLEVRTLSWHAVPESALLWSSGMDLGFKEANLAHVLKTGARTTADSSGGVVPADTASGAVAAVQPGTSPPPGSLPAGVVTAGAARHGRMAARQQQSSCPAIAADSAAGRLTCHLSITIALFQSASTSSRLLGCSGQLQDVVPARQQRSAHSTLAARVRVTVMPPSPGVADCRRTLCRRR